jgi:hypothetical protein
MILRAVFWIALVSVLIPHEPDLGFGRPHMGFAFPAKVADWAKENISQSGGVCADREKSCAAGLTLLDSFQSMAVRSMAQVRADIEQNRRERGFGARMLMPN